MMWFAFELHGDDVRLAERCAAVAVAAWLFPVAFTARRARPSDPSKQNLVEKRTSVSTSSSE
jgi:hypothetical protein